MEELEREKEEKRHVHENRIKTVKLKKWGEVGSGRKREGLGNEIDESVLCACINTSQ